MGIVWIILAFAFGDRLKELRSVNADRSPAVAEDQFWRWRSLERTRINWLFWGSCAAFFASQLLVVAIKFYYIVTISLPPNRYGDKVLISQASIVLTHAVALDHLDADCRVSNHIRPRIPSIDGAGKKGRAAQHGRQHRLAGIALHERCGLPTDRRRCGFVARLWGRSRTCCNTGPIADYLSSYFADLEQSQAMFKPTPNVWCEGVVAGIIAVVVAAQSWAIRVIAFAVWRSAPSL